MCREPGWNDALRSAKHADRSDSGIRNGKSTEWSVLGASVQWEFVGPGPNSDCFCWTLDGYSFCFIAGTHEQKAALRERYVKKSCGGGESCPNSDVTSKQKWRQRPKLIQNKNKGE
jgi:hypothetical protein